MNRLTDDKNAEKLREVSDKLKAGGFEVDVSNERYIKLADYERIAETPEELRKYIGRLCSDLQKKQARLERYEDVEREPEKVEELRQRSMRFAEHEQTGIAPEQIKQVVRCKDCAFVDSLECPINYIDHQRMIFTNRAPDWFCAEGRKKDEQPEA